MTDEKEKVVIGGVLIRGDRVDADGDYFSAEVLEAMAAQANQRIHEQGGLLCAEKFDTRLQAVQGKLISIGMNAGNMVGEVELFDTPAGNRAKQLTSVSVVPEHEKTK